METAAKDSLELQGKTQSSEIRKLHSNENKTEQPKLPEKRKPPCYRCAAELHDSSACRFKTEHCSKCGKMGHIQREQKSKRKQNYFCEEDDDNFRRNFRQS